MQNVLNLLSGIQIYIIIGLTICIIILVLLVMILFNSLSKLEKRYKKFMRGVDNKNIEQLVVGYLENVDKVKEDTEKMKSKIENMDSKVKSCIQKYSMIRYRAFEDVGSDLSFSVALLDGNNDGVLITGIYGRNESTTYAKPIDKGLSRYDLSEEEQQVLENAINEN